MRDEEEEEDNKANTNLFRFQLEKFNKCISTSVVTTPTPTPHPVSIVKSIRGSCRLQINDSGVPSPPPPPPLPGNRSSELKFGESGEFVVLVTGTPATWNGAPGWMDGGAKNSDSERKQLFPLARRTRVSSLPPPQFL